MLGVDHVYMPHCHETLKALEELCDEIRRSPPTRILYYVGTTCLNLEPMRHVGMPVCPADAVAEIVDASRYVSQFGGGQGCVRDVVEQVMRARGDWYKEGDALDPGSLRVKAASILETLIPKK